MGNLLSKTTIKAIPEPAPPVPTINAIRGTEEGNWYAVQINQGGIIAGARHLNERITKCPKDGVEARVRVVPTKPDGRLVVFLESLGFTRKNGSGGYHWSVVNHKAATTLQAVRTYVSF